jgi:amino acid transporter
MQRVYGERVAAAFTLLVLWTAFGSVFALLLGYSRIPYAAARDGYFFAPFGRLHPTGGFPALSLIVLGVIAIGASRFDLADVIDALIATRILVQFIGQIAAVAYLRRTQPEMPRPYRVWLYPVPAVIALAGWTFIFLTTNIRIIGIGLGLLALGVACFFVWSARKR